jgi:mRNA interferase MazF
MVIQQGDVLWVDLPQPRGSEPGGRRPVVVLQHDRFNRSAINTIVVAAVTAQLKRAGFPATVRLRGGEAGLPKPSVVNLSQLLSIDRSWIIGRTGRVSATRLAEIWDGVRLVLEPDPEPV